MACMRREEVFSPDEIAIVHITNRVARRCFLMGNDPVTGKNYDHRKRQIEGLFERFAGLFAIDLLTYSILSNHFHAELRSRPDIVRTWSDLEVARRWMLICPRRKNKDGTGKEPSQAELNAITNNPKRLADMRRRLSDISWWMRLVCQRIGMQANREEGMSGRFWECRFRAVRLLDETATLACSIYIDLNQIRAAIAETLEESYFSSARRRIEALLGDESRARFLAPVWIDERNDPLGPQPSSSGYRCSDKGFLPLQDLDYLQLVDWTARQIVQNKSGHTPHDAPRILQRLGLEVTAWSALVQDFGRMFVNVAGKLRSIDECRSRTQQRRFHIPRATREVLAEVA
jgi:hypothetical protein